MLLTSPNKGSLRLGCGEWGFRELPLEDHFRIAHSFGFGLLEIGIGGGKTGRLPTRMDDAQIARLDALRREHRISTPFCCIENDFTLGKTEHNAMLAETLEQIRLAARLGATHVRLFAGQTPAAELNEKLWEQLLKSFRIAQRLCDSLGLVIAIETLGSISVRDGVAYHEPGITSDRRSMERLVRELPPQIGFNFDPGNLKAADPADRDFHLDLIGNRINYCHLKDWRRKAGGWEPVAMGEDDLDYAALLPRIKYEGVYLIEYEPTEDVEAGIRRSLDYLAHIGYKAASL